MRQRRISAAHPAPEAPAPSPDTVAITLSREDAEALAQAAGTMYSNKAHGYREEWRRIDRATRAALQPTTPERRE